MRRGTGLLSFWKYFISFISDMSVYLGDATPGSNEGLIPLATVYQADFPWAAKTSAALLLVTPL